MPGRRHDPPGFTRPAPPRFAAEQPGITLPSATLPRWLLGLHTVFGATQMPGRYPCSGSSWIEEWRGNMKYALALVAAFSVAPALAHHGWGSYDAERPITLKGS